MTLNPSEKKLIAAGLRVTNSKMFAEDKLWSQYSNDKVDIGHELTQVIRTLHKALPLAKTLRALSIGSSNEPQFRILESAFRGGLYLLEIEKEALAIVKERVIRQATDHVTTISGNYLDLFMHPRQAQSLFHDRLDGKKMDLITLHHSLYYCRQALWPDLLRTLWRHFLARQGAIHAVLMAAQSRDTHTTTWLYNHFAGKFCGHRNDQDLKAFGAELRKDRAFADAEILMRRSQVRFWVNDFAKFMAVIWMILLYPRVHRYTPCQKEEITEFVYHHFWRPRRPLLQAQDHLIIYRGIKSKGLA